MDKPNIGAWIDDQPKAMRSAAYWDDALEHGIQVAALMLETSREGFDPKLDLDTVEIIRDHCLARDIEVALTVWADPSAKYVAQFEEKIGAYLSASGAVELENDAEHNWKSARLKGFKSMSKAAEAVGQSFDRVQDKYDVRTALTTFPGHAELGVGAVLAPKVNRLFGQGYSVRNRTAGAVEWGTRYAPGGMQDLTLKKTLEVPGVGTTNGPLVCAGLAAYDQVWPNHTAQEAMQLAYDRACTYAPVEIRYWSSKWIWGFKKNRYASAFLKSLAHPR